MYFIIQQCNQRSAHFTDEERLAQSSRITLWHGAERKSRGVGIFVLTHFLPSPIHARRK